MFLNTTTYYFNMNCALITVKSNKKKQKALNRWFASDLKAMHNMLALYDEWKSLSDIIDKTSFKNYKKIITMLYIVL